MIELLETPTFVVDDYFDAKDIKLFKYLDVEKIPYEVLEISSAELNHRNNLYYPVILDDINDDFDLFKNVNSHAIELAKNSKMTLMFIYEGHKNISEKLRGSLLTQMLQHQVSFPNLRIITSVKTLSIVAPYVYFSFAEMDAYIGAIEGDLFVDGFCETQRERVFSCNVPEDTPHARLLCASIWYHALADYSYMNYPEQTDNPGSILNSPIYHWNEHWTSTSTLMDMFGQQLPVVNEAGCELDYYNNSYWNFAIMSGFRSKELSIGPTAFKPILNLQPFIIVGPSNSLTLLKGLGYKTFGDFVNETYDKIGDDESRMQDLFRLTYEMAHFTVTELNELNSKLRNILIHNQQHLLSSKKFKLITLLNSLKTRS